MDDKRVFYYVIDFLSQTPSLRIFSNNNYKTTWGVIISLISLIIPTGFFIYSFNYYLKFNNPNIISIKESSTSIKRKINLNETLLMFKITDFYDTYKPYIEYDTKEIKYMLRAVLTEYFYDNSKNNTEYTFLLEKCELGKTIHPNLKEKIEEFEKYTSESYLDYYCINSNENIELYYHPNYGYNELKIYAFVANETFKTYYCVKSKIIVEDDTINDFNKSFPVIEGFKEFSSSKIEKETYSLVNIDLDFFKYESDNSIFIESNTKIYSGVSFGESYTQLVVERDNYNKVPNNIWDSEERYLILAEQIIRIGQKKYFDCYKRSYTKIQSFIAEVKSIIDITVYVCTFLSNIISMKKMKVDIIFSLLKKKSNIKSRHFVNYNNIEEFNNKCNEINSINNSISESKNNINRKIFIAKNENNLKLLPLKNEEKKNYEKIFEKIYLKNKVSNSLNEKIFKKITICDILSSYFCCYKNERINLINTCVDIANKELCIDRILNRMLKLEKLYYLSNDDLKAKIQLMEIPELNEVEEILMRFKNKVLNLNIDDNKCVFYKNNI